MLKIKKSLLSILLVSSQTLVAGTMGNSQSPWDFGISALYLQSTYGSKGLGYSAFSNYGVDALGNNLEVNGATNHVYDAYSKQGWGFQIEGAYHINSVTDFDINWYHFNNKTNDHLPTGAVFGARAAGLYAGLIQVKPKWDAVNVELGKQVMMTNSNFDMHFYVGAEYVDAQVTIINYPSLTTGGPPLFITTDRHTFQGFGPRLGADLKYGIANHLKLYTKPAASLLVGTAQYHISGYSDYAPESILFSPNNFFSRNNSLIIPEFEVKLGAQYDYIYKSNNTITFDAGYLWLEYLQLFTRFTPIGCSGVACGLPTVGSSVTSSFDLNGLYVSLKWRGQV